MHDLKQGLGPPGPAGARKPASSKYKLKVGVPGVPGEQPPTRPRGAWGTPPSRGPGPHTAPSGPLVCDTQRGSDRGGSAHPEEPGCLLPFPEPPGGQSLFLCICSQPWLRVKRQACWPCPRLTPCRGPHGPVVWGSPTLLAAGRAPTDSACVLVLPQDSIYIFREGALPPYRQMFYQLCDLNVEEYVWRGGSALRHRQDQGVPPSLPLLSA